MIQMTTPTHSFSLPITVDKIADVRITYAQKDVKILTKTTADCDLEGQKISVTLTQNDTKLFTPKIPIQIQINLKTVDGKRLASRQFSVVCDDNLDDGVM